MGAKCREEKCGAAGYAKPPCPLKGWREGQLCEKHIAHGRRGTWVARDKRLKHTRFRMMREDGREMLGYGKTQLCEIRCCAGDTVRMGGTRRGARLKHTRFGCGGRMGAKCREEKCGAAGYAKPPCPLKGWREGRLLSGVSSII